MIIMNEFYNRSKKAIISIENKMFLLHQLFNILISSIFLY